MRMKQLLSGKKDIWRLQKKEGKLKNGDMRKEDILRLEKKEGNLKKMI